MPEQSFALTADAVVLAVRDGRPEVLVIRRGGPPYEGSWALPGGFVEADEDLPDAAARELAEEAGVHVDTASLTQVGAYGAPGRDPRGRTVTVAYAVVLPQVVEPTAGDDAAHAAWRPVEELLEGEVLAFDHDEILRDALARVRDASGDFPIP